LASLWHIQLKQKLSTMQKFPKSIFVVDDDRFHLEIMRQLLSAQGIEAISCFTSGLDCLNELHQNPDAIFLDHHMDVYSGFETLRKIKRYNPNIFVVMVSAQEDIDTAVATLKHGAFDYIQKNERLEENIKATLSSMEHVRELLNARKPSLLKSIFQLL
jgi:DNA-binding NtrC family response regulator